MIYDIVIGIAISLIIISLVLVCAILIQKKRHDRHIKNVDKARTYLIKRYLDKEAIPLNVSKRFFFNALIDVDEQIHLEPDIREAIVRDFENVHFMRKMKRQINSKIAFKRKIALYYVSKLRTKDAYQRLMKRFSVEKNEAVKLRIIYNMRYGMNETYLMQIMESFVGASNMYQRRLATVLGSNIKRIYDIFPKYAKDDRSEIRHALIRMSSFFADSFMTAYMLEHMNNLLNQTYLDQEQQDTLETILKNLLKFTPEFLNHKDYIVHQNPLLRKYAIKAYEYKTTKEAIDELMASFDVSELDDVRIETLSQMVFKEQQLFDDLLNKFPRYNLYQKQRTAVIFNERLEYIILKLYYTKPERLREIISILLDQMVIESLIDFINHNKNEKLERFLLAIMKNHAGLNEEMTRQFRIYLDPEILATMGLDKLVPERKTRDKPPIEKTKIRWIFKWVAFTIILLPLIYMILHINTIWTTDINDTLKGYVIGVNEYMVVYFGVINIIYTVLLLLSFVGSRRQVALANTRKKTLLFSEKLLPGISIIAPAYNESLSIIESVTSLLNLKYPDYEVVVVNDGSKDNTLQILIDHFELERKHAPVNLSLNTKNIRAIYLTKTIPNLLVVDKENGGKADALNVGINVSKKSFVCGIDADSILEGDALLKLASAMLDDTNTYVALGGNIYPANGFKFDKGKAEYRGIPEENVCRFQSIEYLRAFTSGRIGWSMMNSLMIISGAFGLFKKDLLIETGGYLTSSSKLKKDTVGEDMELVVRLTRQALERKDKYKVKYVYNAYCYTELPSDMKTLLKQRNRWQRGLIDILSYHRKIGFNPKYKQIGLIGYPYFFIFEFLGPFFETQGYIMLALGLIFGWLTPTVILAIFTVSILFGVVISLSSLFMSEKEIKMMSTSELMVMLGYAIMENFGYRQLISVHRMFSTFSAIRETGQWGAQKRKGFNT